VKILLADDDHVTRRLLQRSLERTGFEVICVADGESAAECLLAVDGPRMAILDWVMPGQDGPAVCRVVRASANPYVYMILLTSRETSGDVVEGLEAGADDYMTKPCNVQEMRARLRSGQRILDLQDKLMHDAQHDSLTDLPNRAFFVRRLKESVRRAQLRPSYRFAVLFVDIDRFKAINDSLGHTTGDALMKGAAQRMLEAVRTETVISPETFHRRAHGGLHDVVARIGGDEFVILLDDFASVRDAIRVAERIQKAMEEPFVLDGQEVFITASIGISTNNEGAIDPAEILRGADVAMYKAKVMGRARYQVSEPVVHSAAAERFRLESDLRVAMERGELEVQYQPIVELDDLTISSFEALARWRHPERGMVPPDVFIPVAEESGLILPIGRWVMSEACRQMKVWCGEKRDGPPVVVCVNVSPRQFLQQDVVETVSGVLLETGLEPWRLELEVTENLTMQDSDRAVKVLRDLADLGLMLSMDDFGTGYSSLSYLHRFPLRTLKIDRSFVAEIETCKESYEIVQTIVALGHALGMKVIAEGIETKGQVAMLRVLKCDLGQGYLFSRPVNAEKATALLRAKVPAREVSRV
jgi:predicted signal transduction protein with EAL and GGDEF domain